MESIGFRNNEKREDWASFFNGEATALENLLSFLSTLESEKPMNLEERIGSYNIVPYIDDKIAKLQDMWREEKVSFDWDDLKDMIEDVARHFAQWGAEHLANSNDEVVINGHKVAYDKDKDAITMEEIQNDMEEAANNYLDGVYGKIPHSDLHIAIFIAGAKWDREQIMKEAVQFYEILKVVPPGPERDKVRVIIVKEDKK